MAFLLLPTSNLLLPLTVYTCTPYNHAPWYQVTSCQATYLGCTRVYLHFSQTDRDFFYFLYVLLQWHEGGMDTEIRISTEGWPWEENSPAPPTGTRTRDLSITSPAPLWPLSYPRSRRLVAFGQAANVSHFTVGKTAVWKLRPGMRRWGGIIRQIWPFEEIQLSVWRKAFQNREWNPSHWWNRHSADQSADYQPFTCVSFGSIDKCQQTDRKGTGRTQRTQRTGGDSTCLLL